MQSRPILLDANLLVLLTVGMASKSYIRAHKRLSAYTPSDYEALMNLIEAAPRVIVTPNTVTEASNLARQINDPARTHIAAVLRSILDKASEIYIASRQAASSPAYLRLGIADAAMLDHAFAEPVLLTADLDLYLEAARQNREAVNFTHLIEANQ